MGLLCVTLLKLFFHDLAQLGQLYRIGAFIGVAVIAMLASFAYQKFFSATAKPKEAKDETHKVDFLASNCVCGSRARPLARCVSAPPHLPADWQHAQQFRRRRARPGENQPAGGNARCRAARARRPAALRRRRKRTAVPHRRARCRRPRPSRARNHFKFRSTPTATVITLETGLAQPLDGVTLESPAANFIKAVRVEGSADGQNWQTLAQGQPIFRQLSRRKPASCSISGRRVAIGCG